MSGKKVIKITLADRLKKKMAEMQNNWSKSKANAIKETLDRALKHCHNSKNIKLAALKKQAEALKEKLSNLEKKESFAEIAGNRNQVDRLLEQIVGEVAKENRVTDQWSYPEKLLDFAKDKLREALNEENGIRKWKKNIIFKIEAEFDEIHHSINNRNGKPEDAISRIQKVNELLISEMNFAYDWEAKCQARNYQVDGLVKSLNEMYGEDRVSVKPGSLPRDPIAVRAESPRGEIISFSFSLEDAQTNGNFLNADFERFQEAEGGNGCFDTINQLRKKCERYGIDIEGALELDNDPIHENAEKNRINSTGQ